jgi:hypothetical protein
MDTMFISSDRTNVFAEKKAAVLRPRTPLRTRTQTDDAFFCLHPSRCCNSNAVVLHLELPRRSIFWVEGHPGGTAACTLLALMGAEEGRCGKLHYNLQYKRTEHSITQHHWGSN